MEVREEEDRPPGREHEERCRVNRPGAGRCSWRGRRGMVPEREVLLNAEASVLLSVCVLGGEVGQSSWRKTGQQQ